MNSRTTPEFWDAFAQLPPEVQRLAARVYSTWRTNERHPGLHFKRVHATESIWSVRIGIHYRAVGRLTVPGSGSDRTQSITEYYDTPAYEGCNS